MRRYGCWAGNQRGIAEDKERCIVKVGEYIFRQCNRKRGYGKNGELCKQHAKMEAEGRTLFIPEEK